ncbi:hypothetical protein PRZ48_014114 [Zasmidium cellare]|uniref:Uncharacterized protein n=1 Tax=Zasmidium cellare TaxID=395010 RepID=A0ABR0E0S4_ZASCE|nr:hypothetical protein PRZ48_014114 [Zasmidium cellare]
MSRRPKQPSRGHNLQASHHQTPSTNAHSLTPTSHIFCLPCADRLDLTVPRDGQRKCPACATYLLNPDDAVVTSLNPSEDYKTSILSGLSPTVIVECAGRGLQFWSYQMAQEITYQDYLARSLKDKYAVLGAQFDNVVREAEEETGKLVARVEDLQAREQHLLNKFQQMETERKDKDKKYKQMETLYLKARQQLQAGGIELAANQDAEQALQADTQFHSSQVPPSGMRLPRSGSNGSGDRGQGHSRPPHINSQFPSQGTSAQFGRATGSSHTLLAPTPSGQHRQPLPKPLIGNYNASIRQPVRRDQIPQATPRQFARPLNHHGLSANVRTGRPVVPPSSRQGYGVVGSQFHRF